ncbi:MAG: hypothetical protein MUF64_21175 [Polyangiaceae bacterium]|jgi:hypothetical protein|nr:hypothetical protein [Polyangiaceae bacterium]
MKRTRFLLLLGVASMVYSAGEPAIAGTTGEVEGGLHGGTGAGNWACGPSARLNFGGLGARGRVWLSPQEQAAVDEAVRTGALPRGFSVGAAAVAEARRYKLSACRQDPCEGDARQVPPDSTVGAASISVGYDGEWVGARGGVLATQRFRRHTDRSPTLELLPDVALRVGKQQQLRGELGLGSYSIDTLLRPGLYVGGTLPVSSTLELTARLGVHRVFDGSPGARLDLSSRWRLGGRAHLELAGGISEGEGSPHPHGRLLVGATF